MEMFNLDDDNDIEEISKIVGDDFKVSIRLLKSALDMCNQGANTNTPLDKLLKEDVIRAIFISIMSMSGLGVEEKATLMAATTIIALRELEIGLW